MTLMNNTPNFNYEHQLIKELYASGEFHMPIRYIWMLTNDCNLRCPFCFMEHINPADAMSAEDWLEVLSQIPENARVVLMGGEPLYYKAFREVYPKVAAKCRCTVVTNGTLLNEEMVELLLSGEKLCELSVSIEMLGNFNRGFTSFQWDRLVDGMKMFAERRNTRHDPPRLGVSTILLDDNSDQLFELYRFCRETLHCDNVTYNLLNGTSMQLSDRMLPFDRLYDHSHAEGIFYEKWDTIKEQLYKIRNYDHCNGIQSTYFRPKLIDFDGNEPMEILDSLNQPRIDDSHYAKCMYPWSDCRIYGDGSVSPCLSYAFGNFKKTPDLKSILSSENADRFRQSLRKERFFPQCFRCVFQYDKKFEV